MKKGIYYIGRVVKVGNLDQEKLIEAIRNPRTVEVRNFLWTFIDTADELTTDSNFIFSKLAKYSQEGHIPVVDPNTNSQRDSVTPNLLISAAPFVYLPQFSGIAYLHVWNGVEEKTFRNRFKRLIEQAYDNFFVNCEIEPIADYRAFVAKLKSLKKFKEIHATVHPPNPLFGDLWKELRTYMKERQANEIKLTEKSDTGLYTNLTNLIDAIVENRISEISKPASFTDAALLMAADGYGIGKVSGETDDENIIIRTSDTQKSFLFSKEPDPVELAQKAAEYLKNISDEREMEHD